MMDPLKEWQLPTEKQFADTERYITGLPDEEAIRLLDTQINHLFDLHTNVLGRRCSGLTVQGSITQTHPRGGMDDDKLRAYRRDWMRRFRQRKKDKDAK